MGTRPGIWHSVALGLTALNLVGLGMAAQSGEAAHATIHGLLAVACGVWAWWLRGRSSRARTAGVESSRLEALEGDLTRMRQELVETQERLDFAERMLAQGKGQGRVGPHR